MSRTVLNATSEGLKQRLAKIERAVADLHRDQSWQFDAPESDAGSSQAGGAEAFSFQASVNLAADTSADPAAWVAPQSGTADQFATAGITGVPGSGTFTQITLPAGYWALGLHGDLDAATTPTSGRVLTGHNLGTTGSYHGWETAVPWQAFTTDDFDRATVHGEKLVYSDAPFTASVYVSNFLNVAIEGAELYWTGRQVAVTDVGTGGAGTESDADGERLPIHDPSGTVVGYLGYSQGGDLFGLWLGDADGAINYDTSLLSLVGGGIFAQNDANSASLLLAGSVDGGAATIKGTTIKFFSSLATGVDGTDTPSTAAQLADVLVNLGVIASHSIP